MPAVLPKELPSRKCNLGLLLKVKVIIMLLLIEILVDWNIGMQRSSGVSCGAQHHTTSSSICWFRALPILHKAGSGIRASYCMSISADWEMETLLALSRLGTIENRNHVYRHRLHDNIHVNHLKHQPELWHQPPELYTNMVTSQLTVLLWYFITEMF